MFLIKRWYSQDTTRFPGYHNFSRSSIFPETTLFQISPLPPQLVRAVVKVRLCPLGAMGSQGRSSHCTLQLVRGGGEPSPLGFLSCGSTGEISPLLSEACAYSGELLPLLFWAWDASDSVLHGWWGVALCPLSIFSLYPAFWCSVKLGFSCGLEKDDLLVGVCYFAYFRVVLAGLGAGVCTLTLCYIEDNLKLLQEENLSLQDYRWLSIETISSDIISNSAESILQDYLKSGLYNKAYVDCGLSDSHGPFMLSHISIENYEKISLEQAQQEFEYTCNNQDLSEINEPLNPDFLADILIKLNKVLRCSDSCFRLRLDPVEDESYRHEWGFPIWEFNEFVFTSSKLNAITVFIFGYD